MVLKLELTALSLALPPCLFQTTSLISLDLSYVESQTTGVSIRVLTQLHCLEALHLRKCRFPEDDVLFVLRHFDGIDKLSLSCMMSYFTFHFYEVLFCELDFGELSLFVTSRLIQYHWKIMVLHISCIAA